MMNVLSNTENKVGNPLKGKADSRLLAPALQYATEREGIEEELKQAAKEWETTFNSITDMVSIQTKDCKLARVNKAYADALKMKPEELVGKTCYEQLHRTKEPWPDCPHKKTLETKKPATVEYYEPHLGIYLEVATSPIFNDKGEVVGSVHVARDITEHKRLEEALRVSKESFHNIVNRNVDGVLIMDRKGIVHFVNPAAEALFGRKADKLLGEMFGLPLVAGDASEIDTIRSSGELGVAEMRVIETEWDGENAYLASVRDITERKRAEEAQERLSQQLQAQVSELEAFSYGIAHDLRSPLVSIEGFSRLLRTDIQNQKMKRVQEDIRLLESGVRKMQQFLNRTLEYSRAGYQVKPIKNVSFGKIVKEVITGFNGQMSSIGATVSLAETFPRVCVDRMRIRQVLSNLIQNSINYRDKTRPLTLEIGHRRSGSEVVFFVRDNGLGIDASEAEKVFALFYRGTADGEGSGAGLAIVKRIIEAHGGRIWVQDQQEKGTTMCFTLSQRNGTNKRDNNGKD